MVGWVRPRPITPEKGTVDVTNSAPKINWFETQVAIVGRVTFELVAFDEAEDEDPADEEDALELDVVVVALR